MTSEKENNEYTTIKLPNDLIEKIDGFIAESNEGYTSRADLIKTAIRNFFRNERKMED